MNVVERSITPEGSAVNHQVIANRSPLSAIKVLMPTFQETGATHGQPTLRMPVASCSVESF